MQSCLDLPEAVGRERCLGQPGEYLHDEREPGSRTRLIRRAHRWLIADRDEPGLQDVCKHDIVQASQGRSA